VQGRSFSPSKLQLLRLPLKSFCRIPGVEDIATSTITIHPYRNNTRRPDGHEVRQCRTEPATPHHAA
jgi:hypothetical protein